MTDSQNPPTILWPTRWGTHSARDQLQYCSKWNGNINHICWMKRQSVERKEPVARSRPCLFLSWAINTEWNPESNICVVCGVPLYFHRNWHNDAEMSHRGGSSVRNSSFSPAHLRPSTPNVNYFRTSSLLYAGQFKLAITWQIWIHVNTLLSPPPPGGWISTTTTI